MKKREEELSVSIFSSWSGEMRTMDNYKVAAVEKRGRKVAYRIARKM